MRRSLLLTGILVAGFSSLALAQKAAKAPPTPPAGVKLSDVAGTWEGKTMTGPKDSVVATYTLKATADGKGWMTLLKDRDPIPTRVLTVGGDSVVTEAGPFLSILRQGQMVTTRFTGHFKGDQMTGTAEAKYASGDVVMFKAAATRKK